jgi:hypothetical protein
MPSSLPDPLFTADLRRELRIGARLARELARRLGRRIGQRKLAVPRAALERYLNEQGAEPEEAPQSKSTS